LAFISIVQSWIVTLAFNVDQANVESKHAPILDIKTSRGAGAVFVPKLDFGLFQSTFPKNLSFSSYFFRIFHIIAIIFSFISKSDNKIITN
jgi:hypothetical protein